MNHRSRAARGQSWSRQINRGRGVAVVAAGVLAALLGPAIPSQAASAAPARQVVGTPSAAGQYIVRAAPGRLDDVIAVLRADGYDLGRRIGIIDAVVATLPAGAADALRADSNVAQVTLDAPVTLQATTYDAVADVNSLYNNENATKVRQMWSKGYTGKGIDVALIDSGVEPVAGLADSGKIINGPDLSPESQSSTTRYADTYGHGTFMAGIIAGHDSGVVTKSAALNTTAFLGVAPDARIVSVKAADAHGNTDVSQVIAGVDWVVQHAHDTGMNVRVLNLSFGTNATQDYTLDPLAYAVEVAWRAGIVVVVSAGNNGTGGMTNPALDPYVIAVGATDTNGTVTISDDFVPDFSSQGGGTRLPDFIAPGSHIQSLRVPGSYIDTTYGSTGLISDRFFRGSGTSQAAAFTSGVAALLVQAKPTYTNDQIKDMLGASANPITGATPQAQGQGVINAVAAANTTPSSTPQSFPQSTGTGSLEGSRGDAHLTLDGVTLTGEVDIFGQPFDSSAMATLEAQGKSWAGGTWNGSDWAGSSWAGSSWASTTWTGKTWAGSTWAGKTWATGTWTSKGWTSTNFTSKTWTGSTWTGKLWAGKDWADAKWS